MVLWLAPVAALKASQYLKLERVAPAPKPAERFDLSQFGLCQPRCEVAAGGARIEGLRDGAAEIGRRFEPNKQ
jgi:hypothetical protein